MGHTHRPGNLSQARAVKPRESDRVLSGLVRFGQSAPDRSETLSMQVGERRSPHSALPWRPISVSGSFRLLIGVSGCGLAACGARLRVRFVPDETRNHELLGTLRPCFHSPTTLTGSQTCAKRTGVRIAVRARAGAISRASAPPARGDRPCCKHSTGSPPTGTAAPPFRARREFPGLRVATARPRLIWRPKSDRRVAAPGRPGTRESPAAHRSRSAE